MKNIVKIAITKDINIVEIQLDKAVQNRIITEDEIKEAIALLYDCKSVEIKEKLTGGEALLPELIDNYRFLVKTPRNGHKVCYSFGCCFIDASACDELAKEDIANNILDCLKKLRGDRFNEHPLYFRDYGKKIENIYKAFAQV